MERVSFSSLFVRNCFDLGESRVGVASIGFPGASRQQDYHSTVQIRMIDFLLEKMHATSPRNVLNQNTRYVCVQCMIDDNAGENHQPQCEGSEKLVAQKPIGLSSAYFQGSIVICVTFQSRFDRRTSPA